MIKEEVENYFQNIFTFANPSAEHFDKALKHVRATITEQFNDDLLHPYTKGAFSSTYWP